MPPPRRLAFLALALSSLASSPAQQWRTGQVADLYTQHCASCHGVALEGGSAPSMLDDEWLHGGDDASLLRSILQGYPENSMPAWSALFSEKEARALVNYIREVRARHRYNQAPPAAPQDDFTVATKHHAYRFNTWLEGLDEPWSLTFLPGPGNRAIVTEKRGRAWLIEDGRRASRPLEGLPGNIESNGQGGLYDVVPHPAYLQNGWLYFAFAELTDAGSMTRVMRARLRDDALVDQQTVFAARADQYLKGRAHFGGRLAFDRAGFLYFTIGERGQRDHAQDLTRPNGKVHRLHDDGRIPADNPFVNHPGAVPSIWSYGHRNPQGLAFEPQSDELYDLEHGPRGGDELNRVRRGANYGWPVITYGIEYSGAPIAESTHREGMEQPVAYWTPSLGVCGLNFYTGDRFPRWRHHLFFASLSGEELRRLELKDGEVVDQEILFKGVGRIRHVISGPDGALYVLLPRRIVRLTPAPAG
ncbi:MAG: C-type cytochrome [Verrucomicrobiota bacterium]|nr:C-type cytochrome [Verrucomicrobiota bacterium]